TAYAHPLTCAAIVTTIETMRDEGLVEQAATRGTWLGQRLAELARVRPFVGEVRGVGMLWALELVVPGSREPLRAEALTGLGAALKRRHVHLHRRDNLVYLAPPLVATEDDLIDGLARVAAALDEAVH
ncbi:MAG: aminotransferase class III-fold pyridoxal phosphate-dependent enzyme, partial [Myxococcales bacterium]